MLRPTKPLFFSQPQYVYRRDVETHCFHSIDRGFQQRCGSPSASREGDEAVVFAACKARANCAMGTEQRTCTLPSVEARVLGLKYNSTGASVSRSRAIEHGIACISSCNTEVKEGLHIHQTVMFIRNRARIRLSCMHGP